MARPSAACRYFESLREAYLSSSYYQNSVKTRRERRGHYEEFLRQAGVNEQEIETAVQQAEASERAAARDGYGYFELRFNDMLTELGRSARELDYIIRRQHLGAWEFVRLNELTVTLPFAGVVPFGIANASTIAVPNSDEYLIVVNEGLPLYLNVMCKVLAKCIIVEKNGARLEMHLTKEAITDATASKSTSDWFTEIVVAQAVNGDVRLAKNELLTGVPQYLQQLLLQAAEMFVLAHEYAHILLGHCDARRMLEEAKDRQVRKFLADLLTHMDYWSWEQEISADALAAQLSAATLKRLYPDLDEYTAFSGLAVFLGAVEVTDSAIELIENGRALPIAGNKTENPQSNVRISHFLDRIKKEFPGQRGDDIAFVSYYVRAILALLFSGAWDRLLGLHKVGVQPVG